MNNKWSNLFDLNRRMAQLFAALQQDVHQVEHESGMSMSEPMDALDNFAEAISKKMYMLNDQLQEARAEEARIKEVDDVLAAVNKKIRLKTAVKRLDNDIRRKNRKKASGESESSL